MLRGIRGEITRASVTAAFRQTNSMERSFNGTPSRFGDHQAHNPNRATLPVRLEGGRGRIAHHRWIIAAD